MLYSKSKKKYFNGPREVTTKRYRLHYEEFSGYYWSDLQTWRKISRETMALRSGLSVQHIKDHEHGDDDHPCTKSTKAQREQIEKELNVVLYG